MYLKNFEGFFFFSLSREINFNHANKMGQLAA